jgi:hypothetical protein
MKPVRLIRRVTNNQDFVENNVTIIEDEKYVALYEARKKARLKRDKEIAEQIQGNAEDTEKDTLNN